MPVYTKCKKSCFSAGRVWEVGDHRIFQSEKDINPHFEKVKPKEEKSLEEMTYGELREYAIEKQIVVPSDVYTESALVAFIKASGTDQEPKKSFSQLSKDEYIKLAAEKGIEIPDEINTRDKIRDFLKDKIEQ